MHRNFQKLVLILVISVVVTKAYKEDKIELAKELYIYYPIKFKKDKIWALINSNNEINTIILVYVA